jgi:hypothetical protein
VPDHHLIKLRSVSKAWQRAVERHVLDIVADVTGDSKRGCMSVVEDIDEKAHQARRIAAHWLVLAAVSHARETGNLRCRMFVYTTTLNLWGFGACPYFGHIPRLGGFRDKETRARWCKMVSKRVAVVLQGCIQNVPVDAPRKSSD